MERLILTWKNELARQVELEVTAMAPIEDAPLQNEPVAVLVERHGIEAYFTVEVDHRAQ